MDLAKLSGLLERHLDLAQRERALLDDAILLFQAESERARVQEGKLARTLSTLESELAEPANAEEASQVTESAHPLLVRWPTGESDGAPKPKRARKWMLEKLSGADWFLAVLRDIEGRGAIAGDLGTEIAIAGAIESMCASFDTAIFALTAAIERHAGIPEDRRTPANLTSWAKAFAEARLFGFELSCRAIVSEAMVGEYSPNPAGWLAQLQLLRTRLVRQDPLVCTSPDGASASGPSVEIEVPGKGAEPPLEYLIAIRERLDQLLDPLVGDIKSVKRQAKEGHRPTDSQAPGTNVAPPV